MPPESEKEGTRTTCLPEGDGESVAGGGGGGGKWSLTDIPVAVAPSVAPALEIRVWESGHCHRPPAGRRLNSRAECTCVTAPEPGRQQPIW